MLIIILFKKLICSKMGCKRLFINAYNNIIRTTYYNKLPPVPEPSPYKKIQTTANVMLAYSSEESRVHQLMQKLLKCLQVIKHNQVGGRINSWAERDRHGLVWFTSPYSRPPIDAPGYRCVACLTQSQPSF